MVEGHPGGNTELNDIHALSDMSPEEFQEADGVECAHFEETSQWVSFRLLEANTLLLTHSCFGSTLTHFSHVLKLIGFCFKGFLPIQGMKCPSLLNRVTAGE
ncbi:hypothetical protein IGI04_023105, partial [Brassica rapa subsp. trilocularis]